MSNSPQQNSPQPTPRPFRPRQFLLGLLLSGTGVSLILSVAFLTDTVRTVTGTLSVPAICTSLLLSILFIGTGFALMSTALSDFDEAEFDRLAASGNVSAFERLQQTDPFPTSTAANVPSSGCQTPDRIS